MQIYFAAAERPEPSMTKRYIYWCPKRDTRLYLGRKNLSNISGREADVYDLHACIAQNIIS